MWLDALNAMKKQSGKTTEQIAEESGIPKGTLNKIFAGQTKDPKYQTLHAIVHCLGFTVDDLDKENSPEPVITDPEEPVTRDQLVDALPRHGRVHGFHGILRNSATAGATLMFEAPIHYIYRRAQNQA